MKAKFLLVSFILTALIFVQPLNVHADEKHYDPQHTVLALNMAVVSIHRILSTNDRAVLDTEYRNIISNLKLGSIESDNEIISLYKELMNAISNKTVNLEAAKKLQANYDAWAEQHITRSVSGASGIIQGIGENIAGNLVSDLAEEGLAKISASFPPVAIVTIAGAVAVSCVSEYYAHQNAKLDAEFRRGLAEDMLRIDRAEHEQYNALKSMLLNSSWRLLRQYHLPDEYRIVQSGVDDLFRAVNETDTAKRRGMLIALEKEFRIYPPYWIYRAEAEQIAGNDKEAAKCFDEFERVWRPVLRNDPWKVEAEKFRVVESLNAGKRDDALNHLDTFCGNIQRSDWTGNIFAGTVYYMLGEKEKGISRVELNINFGAENEISKAILTQMKEGRLDFGKLPEDLRKISGLSSMSIGTLKLLAETGDIEASLILGKIYEDGGISFGLAKIYEEGKITSKDYVIALGLCGTKDGSKNKGDNVTAEISDDGRTAKFTFSKREYTVYRIVARDYAEAVKWYKKAAYEGSRIAQNALAHLYFTGGNTLKQDYYTAYIWCCVAEMTEEHFISATEAGSLVVGIVGGAVALVSIPVAIPLMIGAFVAGEFVGSFFDDYTIKEEIEGAGWFSFAKLSNAEMDKAKIEARKIMAEIERHIKQKQKQQQ